MYLNRGDICNYCSNERKSLQRKGRLYELTSQNLVTMWSDHSVVRDGLFSFPVPCKTARRRKWQWKLCKVTKKQTIKHNTQIILGGQGPEGAYPIQSRNSWSSGLVKANPENDGPIVLFQTGGYAQLLFTTGDRYNIERPRVHFLAKALAFHVLTTSGTIWNVTHQGHHRARHGFSRNWRRCRKSGHMCSGVIAVEKERLKHHPSGRSIVFWTSFFFFSLANTYICLFFLYTIVMTVRLDHKMHRRTLIMVIKLMNQEWWGSVSIPSVASQRIVSMSSHG